MFAVKPLPSLKSDISGAAFRWPPAVGVWRPRLLGPRGKNNRGLVKAVISGGDKTAVAEMGKELSGSGPHSDTDYSSAAASSGKIDVRAVLSVRKKMRQRLVDKMEDQLESFMNAVGQGISLQLVSEEFDPGQSPSAFFLGLLEFAHGNFMLLPLVH